MMIDFGGLARSLARPRNQTFAAVDAAGGGVEGKTLSQSHPAVQESMGRPRILILDDNPQVLEVGRRMMDRLGFDSVIVSGGAEAVARFEESHATPGAFAAVIADLSVPEGMGGLECLERLRDIDPEVKVIACSGDATDPILLDHESKGFIGALEKPFRLEDVRQVFDRAALLGSEDV